MGTIRLADLCNFTKRQKAAARQLARQDTKFLLYGGALGGGKSYFLRWFSVYRLADLAKRGIKNAQIMLACEDYPSLKDRQLSKIGLEFPDWLGKSHSDHKDYGRCFIMAKEYGSGVLCFRNLDDPSKYQSSEWAMICVDELTKNDFDIFDFLRTRLRWPGIPDEQCQFVGGTNPGGIGHAWVKQFWMDKVFPKEWHGYEHLFKYIPSKATDNPHLDKNYYKTLETLPEQLRKAFRDGNWDVYVGQAFPQFSRDIHVIDRLDIPRYAPLYFTFDWGFGAPFSVGWWWADSDGRLFRFSEWYGWNGTANKGMHLEDSRIADEIVLRERILEQEYGISINPSTITRYAGHDCFSKKANYKGGGQGPPTSELFAKRGLFLIKGDSDRERKIRAFRERIMVPKEGMPMLMVYRSCVHFIRTIPNIVVHETKLEDVDERGEDHIYDETAHVCMARPMSLVDRGKKLGTEERRIAIMERKTQDDGYEEHATAAHAQTMMSFGQGVFEDGGIEESDLKEIM